MVGVKQSSDQTCPVRSVQAWLTAARITSGPVFRSVDRIGRVQIARLSDKAVALIIKRSVGRLDTLDPMRYAGHSLRAGLATSAAANGASERTIMAQTGHSGHSDSRGSLKRALHTIARFARIVSSHKLTRFSVGFRALPQGSPSRHASRFPRMRMGII